MKIHKFIIAIFSLIVVASLSGNSIIIPQAQAVTIEELQAQIQSLLQQVQQLQTQLAQLQGQVSTIYNFARNLAVGSTGDDVKALQQFLKDQGPTVYPQGLTTGYFGSLTKKALSSYQKQIGSVSAPGVLGPITREFLNKSKILHRTGRNCSDDSVIKEETFKVGGDTGYWNFRCQNRKQEQCYDDRSFDTYYDEWCEDTTSTVNQPPVITKVTGPVTPNKLNINESGTWIVTAYDPEGKPLSYTVNWGDNSATSTQSLSTFTHNYSQEGLFTITFTIYDDQGLSTYAQRMVWVVSSTTPYITVLSPNTASQWEIGKTYTISWGYTNFSSSTGGNITIELLGLSLRRTLFSGLAKEINNIDWTIPSSTISGTYQIRVHMYGYSLLGDDSDYFKIVAASTVPTITVLSPNGGEILERGVSNYKISWSSSPSVEKRGISLFLKRNGERIGEITRVEPTTVCTNNPSEEKGFYLWDMVGKVDGQFVPAGSGYTIEAVMWVCPSNLSGAHIEIARDESNMPFTMGKGIPSLEIGTTEFPPGDWIYPGQNQVKLLEMTIKIYPIEDILIRGLKIRLWPFNNYFDYLKNLRISYNGKIVYLIRTGDVDSSGYEVFNLATLISISKDTESWYTWYILADLPLRTDVVQDPHNPYPPTEAYFRTKVNHLEAEGVSSHSAVNFHTLNLTGSVEWTRFIK